MKIGLGATLRDLSGRELTDQVRDKIVPASPGSHWYDRSFKVPPEEGIYDLAMAIWTGQPGTSIQLATTGWILNAIHVATR